MQKIAIPVTNGKLAQHFGHCQEFWVYFIENAVIGKKETHTPPPHKPGVYPKWLHSMGVTDVITGGIGQRAIQIFNDNEINVYTGAPIKDPETIIHEYWNGALQLTENKCSH